MIEQNPEPEVKVSGQVRKEVVLEGNGIPRFVAVKCSNCLVREFFRVTRIIDGVPQVRVCWPRKGKRKCCGEE